jgi:hypothetical protein
MSVAAPSAGKNLLGIWKDASISPPMGDLALRRPRRRLLAISAYVGEPDR